MDSRDATKEKEWDIDFDDIHGFFENAVADQLVAYGNTNDLVLKGLHLYNAIFYDAVTIFVPTQTEFQEDMTVAVAMMGVGGVVNYGGRTSVKIVRRLAADSKALWGVGKRLATKLFGKSNVETITVRHYTDAVGKAGITESGFLKGYVTLPTEIPKKAGHRQIEDMLEILPGRGSNYIDVEVPLSNLRVPDNGPFTSGDKWQRQLIEPVKIDPSRWRRPPGRPGG